METRDKKEITRVQALQKFGMTRLPKVAAEGELWAWAVVLVLKTDGKEYYCVQGTDDKGNLVIKNDYEENYGIVKVLKAHPITRCKIELNKKPLAKATRADKVKWLGMCHVDYVPKADALDKMTDGQLDDLCVRALRSREDVFMRTNGAETTEEGSHEE